MQAGTASARASLVAFALALLLSAALLFNIQPMIGKQLLPRVGGTPQVWNVAMAFFQLALLAGYLATHALSRLSIRTHGIIYIGLLVAASAFLPITLPPDWLPAVTGYMPLAVLSILISTVAAPFIALSLSAPTLQRLFSGTQHAQAQDPYFLYVASNLGSLVGLLAYPFVLEPLLAVSAQAALWRYGFFVLIALAVLCLILQLRHTAAPVAHTEATGTAPSWKQRGWWVALSFIPSSLTLGVTTYISTDLTPAPLLWVITLGLYLLSFIVAFATKGQSLRSLCLSAYPWLAAFSAITVLVHINLPWPMVGVSLITFFATAVACHSLLAASRPSPSFLTDFYLWLSVGGALGGCFNAFIAPLVFTQLAEYPLVLILAILVAGVNTDLLSNPRKIANLSTTLMVLSLVNLLMFYGRDYVPADIRNLVLAAFLASAVPLLRAKPATLYGAAVVFLITFTFKPYMNDSIFMNRNFFGIISVSDRLSDDEKVTYRLLEHGTTTHGIQMIEPQRATTPTGYYAPTGPLARIWAFAQPKSLALIGLGAGSLNCYAKPEQQLHFIEIDPMVIEVAKAYFTFLSECPPPRITLGDGRLIMAADTTKYDMIVLDAFSSDSIPVHIITREAIALYLSRLNEGGIIALHTSNRFFNLEPILAAIANDLGLTSYIGRDESSGPVDGVITFPSEAVVLSANPARLDGLKAQPEIWRKLQQNLHVQAWTDSYSNILSAIKANSWLAPINEIPK